MDTSILDEMDLPLSNPNEELETISKQLLMPLFDVSKFEIRPEDVRDKGIDLHIELKTPTKYSNFRLVIQLKATDRKAVNKDETISIQLGTANINYLLNNPGPAYYVLYFKDTNTFYYENLNDFVKTIAEKETDWQKQQSHVLRFAKVLTKEATEEIYKETLQKGLFHRKVNEKLIQQSASIHSSDKVLIDSNLNISVDTEIRNLIETGGFLLINEGRWKDVILLHKKGSQTVASTSKYNLVLGIANYYNGNLVDALSHLKLSDKHKTELVAEMANHLEYFLISVKHSLGLCTDLYYKKRMDELEDADNVGLYIKIDKAKTDYYTNLSGDSADKFDKLITDIQQVLNHPKADNGIKFYAESELVLMQGSKNNWDYVKGVSVINAIELITGPDKARRLDSLRKFIDSNASWFREVQRLKDETLKDKNYFYYFNTIINEVKVIYEMTVFNKVVSIEKTVPGMPAPQMPDPKPIFAGLLEKLAKALEFYRQIGHIENEVVTLSLRYEIEHYLGDFSKATITMSEANNLIDAYELTDKKRRLTHLKNAGTVHEVFSEWIAGVFKKVEADKIEVQVMVKDMQRMDQEERNQRVPDIKYLNIHLFPIGYFRFPERSTDKVYEILRIKDAQLKKHFDQLFTFVIPVANIYYPEIIQEGPLDGKLADKGLENWKNIYRVRKAFYENKFFRDESIP